jgi:hypothetical protein
MRAARHLAVIQTVGFGRAILTEQAELLWRIGMGPQMAGDLHIRRGHFIKAVGDGIFHDSH